MDRKRAEEIISSYEDLVDRAVSILNDTDGPPWGYVSNSEWAKIRFEGEDVVVSYPDSGEYSIDADAERFPAALLFMDEDAFAVWKKRAREDYENQQKERREAELRLIERTEREQFERLRAKYGN